MFECLCAVTVSICVHKYCVVLLVGYGFQAYLGHESSGFIEVDVTISGGLSAIPITVIVNTTEQSARGKG